MNIIPERAIKPENLSMNLSEKIIKKLFRIQKNNKAI